ncbi:insulinase family protein [Winogradskyella echinorum]|uniref:Insulinase family protein n=1 Tax=Winogradskyella echinorum TaxID=538189 RepID=A0ABR6XZL3_9FLAO|nr:pitrilysin family protein [Winogradskyella echinorum]MBC3845916.1 insulinase family protein [Winogradskyella echinorum]MBC5750264.1 insulinase family protein [Winogradskyella echinorum]
MKTKISAFVVLFLMAMGVNAQIDRSKMPEPGPAPKITLEVPGEFELKNGIKVLVVENHKLPRVSYSLTIDNKPITEGKKAGVSSILAAMLGNGTTNISKDEFNEEIDFLGARLGFSAQGGFASSLSKYSDRIIELMADAAINPLLTKEEFEKEKEKLIESIKSNEKSVDAVASRVGSALSYGVNHPRGEFLTEDTVKNIEFGDVLAFYEKYFNPNYAYIVVVGDVDIRDVKKQLKKHFSKWEKAASIDISLPEPQANAQYTQINFVDMPNAVQSNISLTNNVDLKKKDEDYHSVLIANKILGGGFGSYLNMNLREEHGYTYGARSSVGTSRWNASRFTAGAAVRNAVTDSAVVETLKEINRIKTEPVDSKDLANAKAKYVGDFVLALESPQTIARYALDIKLNDLPHDFYTTYLEKINAVSKEDVTRVANKYFKTENARIVVVGKGSEVIENLEKTGIPIKYYDTYAKSVEKPVFEIPIPADMDVTKVLNTYIEKIGGKAKLDNVNSVSMQAEAELQPGVMLNLEMKKTTKNQLLQIVKTPMGAQKQVLDGSAGYSSAGGQKVEMTEDQVKAAQLESSPFPEINYLNGGATLEKIEVFDGQKAYKVNAGENTSIYYSVETGLKIAEVKSSPAGSQTMFFEDYKEVGGILFPFKLSQTFGPRKIAFIIKDLKVNEGVTDADFD